MLERSGWLVVKIIQSNRNGWPDLQCHKDGKTFFIECKAEGKQLPPLQLLRHHELKQKGFNVFTINQLKDVTEISIIL